MAKYCNSKGHRRGKTSSAPTGAHNNQHLHGFALASGSELIKSFEGKACSASKAEIIRQASLDVQLRVGWTSSHDAARALRRKEKGHTPGILPQKRPRAHLSLQDEHQLVARAKTAKIDLQALAQWVASRR